MKRLITIVVMLLFAAMLIGEPAWWEDKGVLTTNAPADYSAVNMGQLKWVAYNAAEHLDEGLAEGAGSNVWNVVNSFSSTNNYYIVNLGQVKALGKVFYDRLIEEGYTDSYPWTASTTDDWDYAAVNIGQVKNMFSFDLFADGDEDGLPDWWEMVQFGDMEETGSGDVDGDGLSNQGEYENGTDPNDTDTDDDEMPDGWEVTYGLNPKANDASGDADGDGVDNLTEYLQGRDPCTGVESDTEGIVNLVVYTILE